MVRTALPIRHLAVATLALCAAGCSTLTPVPTTVDVTGMPNPEIALQKSMQHVDAEMAQLGGLSARPASFIQPAAPAPIERTVDFTWSGSLDAGVAKLAQSVGYTFFTNNPSSQPGVSVSINLRGVTALDAFRALGERAGTAATVEVDPIRHSVQVMHHA